MQRKRPIPTICTKSVRVWMMALVGTFDCVPKVINCIFVEAAASNGSGPVVSVRSYANFRRPSVKLR